MVRQEDQTIMTIKHELFPEISESHLSKIRITLRILDEALGKFAEWAQGREVRAVLYEEENDLTPHQRAGILADVSDIRQIMQELRDNLAMEVTPQSVAKHIRASCYIYWVDVLEMTGKYLRGFGEPSQELVDYLDPKAQRILQYLDHIKDLLTNPGLSKQAAPGKQARADT
jgi:hypothetical protein